MDEQLNDVPSGSNFIQAQNLNTLQVLTSGQLVAPKSGYLMVYVSNETPDISAAFDNLRIHHRSGPLVQEDDYYAFGLAMGGISSRTVNIIPAKEKTFQGQQIDDELGLNWIQFKWRNHDPQIGRFIQIDPLANDYLFNSPYAFSENVSSSDKCNSGE